MSTTLTHIVYHKSNTVLMILVVLERSNIVSVDLARYPKRQPILLIE
jgi:hypothetical protein